MNPATVPIPVDAHGPVYPYIMGGSAGWKLAWGHEGLTRPEVFYEARNWSDAIRVKHAIEARIAELVAA